jgi:hypothetical protein
MVISRSQSAIVGMRPKSSRQCCSPIQRTGIFFPVEMMIVGPKWSIAHPIPCE